MNYHEGNFNAIVEPSSSIAQVFKDLCIQQIKTALPEKPDMWEKLTPKYDIGCKRLLVSDDYYPCCKY